MKRIFLLLLLLSLLLTGCGSEKTSIISEVNTASEFSMSYTSFTGTRTAAISISDSATAAVTGVLSSSSGNLSIRISDEAGNVAFAADDVSGSASFSVSLTGPGEYIIEVSADAHTGSFSFTWEVIGAAVQSESASDTWSSIQDADAEPDNTADAVSDNTAAEADEADSALSDTDTEGADTDDTNASSVFSDPNWNGIFTSADSSISLEFWLADNSSCEFAFTKGDLILMGVARIDPEIPAVASCTFSDAVVSFEWYDQETLTVTATGATAALALDPTGVYTFTEMN